ncbi:MAG TPA: sulfate transporter [Desulfovibrio sp.]|nr:sulfate transporter [Desulfovibrio sp.]
MSDAPQAREGFMEDAQGRLVPLKMVKPIDQARDQLVREIAGKAVALREAMRGFRDDVLGDVAAFIQLSAEQYDARVGGTKGNVTLTSYDGRFKVQRAVAETLVFDERLQAAKSLIDECMTEWTEGSRDELKALINDTFRVDSTGSINTGRVLGLRRLAIDDDRWRRAMQAVSDSLQVSGTKAYVRVYARREDGKYEAIALDLAAL